MTNTMTSARTRSARPSVLTGRWRTSASGLGLALVLPVIIAIAWEIAGRQNWIANGLFPPLSSCVAALANWVAGWQLPIDGFVASNVYSATWLTHVGASVGRVLTGFVLGAVLAITFGVLAGVSSVARRMVDPTINAIRPISVTGWVPLALIVFGIGDKPAVFLTALATFFPVYVNTFAGVSRVDAGLLRASAMLGASRARTVRDIVLPAASPSLVTGLRVASGIAWTTVVVAEILGAKSGVGYVLIDSYNQFRFDYVIAAMATLGLLGYVTDRLLQWVFADALRWSDR
ncbi:ABC transporter permease [Aeromicrobium sp. YIM 150415]|uniref:ABC transporter permease n=1 Tax=Aeromicrobium sp. YIM 150415 TaxID=2803912 RepID=UPI001963FC50|nr:ABC transporter permease [Aeromicrobium sp. YIM 150415]MBM9464260.1 ABC transporter permease [Aeromicrobium sp. YIM 150415]